MPPSLAAMSIRKVDSKDARSGVPSGMELMSMSSTNLAVNELFGRQPPSPGAQSGAVCCKAHNSSELDCGTSCRHVLSAADSHAVVHCDHSPAQSDSTDEIIGARAVSSLDPLMSKMER